MPLVAQTGSRGIVLLTFNVDAVWAWVVSFTPRPLFTPGKQVGYPLYRRLGGLQGRSGRVCGKENFFPTPGFEPLTVQPVASRYTDYPVPAPVRD
jgi:hypothetical protein